MVGIGVSIVCFCYAFYKLLSIYGYIYRYYCGIKHLTLNERSIHNLYSYLNELYLYLKHNFYFVFKL